MKAAPDGVLAAQATAFHVLPDSSSPHSARVCRANTQATSFMKPHWGVVGAVRVLTATFALLVMTACGGGWGAITGQAPAITSQPANLTVNPGQPATFTVTATGTATLTYQWYKNGTAISGATSNSYTNPAAASTDSGSVYTVTVTNAEGTVTSTPATLTVAAGSTTVNPDAPVITKQPANQTVTVGQTATFSVTATGAATLTYQWYNGGVAIGGATSSTYTTPATVIGNSGSLFTVTVTNADGTVTSTPATLTVTTVATPPVITTQPANQTVNAGQTAAFSVTASGTGPLTYQWYKNGTAIGGATSSTYTTPATVSGDSGSLFTVTVTNTGGTVTSAPATLTVNTPPTITTQPASQTVAVGQTATFNVVATGTAPLTYQWYKGGIAIAGATSGTYTTPATVIGNNNSQYTVTVTNVAGTVTSTVATLTVTNSSLIPPVLFCSNTAPPYNSSVNLIPTFSGGTGIIGSAGIGSADITSSAVSGSSYPTPGLTTTKTYTLSVTGTGGASASATCTVTPTNITISSISPANQTMAPGKQTFTATASGGATNNLTWTATGGTFVGNVWTSPNTVGTYTITATSVDEPSVSVTTTVTVTATQSPTLTFAPVSAQTYGNQPFNVSASSASFGQVSYSIVSGPATISGNTVTITGVGTIVVGAAQAAAGNYTSATAQVSVNVAPATPTLTFAAIPPQIFGNAPFQVNASSVSSGNVTYSIVSGPGAIVGNIITMTGTGTIVIGASQAATTDYTSASAQVSVFVDAASTTTQKLVPIEVLDPTSQGALSLSGSASLKIVGGPQVGLEINSSGASAVSCSGNAHIDVSNGGPNFTGSTVNIVGGPVSPPSSCFSAGSTGGWNADSSSITDPFASVPSPTQPALSTTASGPHTVAYQQDGCPYNNAAGCGEFEPGYYPNGINLGGNPVIIFKPGIYFLGGSIQISGGIFRPATPCTPTCSQYSTLQGAATDGVLFYFTSGSGLVLAGNSGKSMTGVDDFPSTSLSCNGSAPPAVLNAPSMLSGNVLLAQCSAQGTYIGAPSTDFAMANGFRGLLVFTDRNATNANTSFSGSGSMALAGVVYVHTNQNTGLVDFSGSSGTSSYVVGDFVVDDLHLSGSGSIAISLSNVTTSQTSASSTGSSQTSGVNP